MKRIKTICVHVFLLTIFVLPVFVHGQATGNQYQQQGDVNNGAQISIKNPLKVTANKDSLFDVIVMLLDNVIMPIAAVGSVLFLLWAGFRYVMAQGKPAEIEKANKNLMWGMIGIGVLLGAAGISRAIQGTVGQLIAY